MISLFYLIKTPERVLSFAEILLILWCRERYALGITYSMKVFSLLSLNGKSDSFQRNEDNDSTHFLYSYVAMHSLCIHPILSKCGVLYRLFVSGFVRASIQINGNQLHTFFLFITHHRGAYGFERRLTQTIVEYDTIRTERLPHPRNRGE